MNEGSNIPETLWEDIEDFSYIRLLSGREAIELDNLKEILDKYFSQDDKFY